MACVTHFYYSLPTFDSSPLTRTGTKPIILLSKSRTTPKSFPLGFGGDGVGDVSAFILCENRRLVCLTLSYIVGHL
jgi:hypothetical protein